MNHHRWTGEWDSVITIIILAAGKASNYMYVSTQQ